jgi:hypothetical protein
MAQERLHVVPHEEGWAVKAENTSGTESTHSTQREAIDAARDMCRKHEADLVIHRQDGTIRNVYAYGESNNNSSNGNIYEEETMSTRTERRERVELNDVASVGSRISWGAILGGAFVALSMIILLGVLCTALGLTVTDRVTDRTMYYGAMVATAVVALVALFIGGYIASCATAGETKGEAVMYGLILWGTVFAMLTTLTAAGANVGYSALMASSSTEGGTALSPKVMEDAGLERAQIERLQRSIDEGRPAQVSPTTAAWFTFGGILLSMATAVGGAIVGAGPTLFLRRVTVTAPARVGTTV